MSIANKRSIFYFIYFYIFLFLISSTLRVEAITATEYHFPTKIDESTGEEVVDTESEEYKACKEVYDILMNTYRNEYVVCGIIGNLMRESGPKLNPQAISDNGAYHGIAQWCMYDDFSKKSGKGRWGRLKDFAGSAENKSGDSYTSRSAQAYYIIYEMSSRFPRYNVSVDEFLALQDVVTAAEVFCANYEGCTGGSDIIESEWFINKWGGEDYKTRPFQALADRRGYAIACLETFSGTKVTYYEGGSTEEIADSSTKTRGALMGDKDLGIVVDDWYDIAIDLPSADSLELDDRFKIANWKQDVEGSTGSSAITWIRSVVAFIGILIVIYSAFIYIAYWFDRINNFVEISMLNVITFGRLEISPDDKISTFSPKTQGKKLIVHRDAIFISLLGICFGVVLLSGLIYDIIYAILNLIRRFIK